MSVPQELAKALALVRQNIDPVVKNRSVKNKDGVSVRYNYADLGSVAETINEQCAQFGLAYFFTPATIALDPLRVVMRMVVVHVASGESLDFPCDMPCGSDPQSNGSAQTYAKRYALYNVFGVCPVDDDGLAAKEGAERDRKRAEEQEAKTIAIQKAVAGSTMTKQQRIDEAFLICNELFDEDKAGPTKQKSRAIHMRAWKLLGKDGYNEALARAGLKNVNIDTLDQDHLRARNNAVYDYISELPEFSSALDAGAPDENATP